jgi:hypothetical protein
MQALLFSHRKITAAEPLSIAGASSRPGVSHCVIYHQVLYKHVCEHAFRMQGAPARRVPLYFGVGNPDFNGPI